MEGVLAGPGTVLAGRYTIERQLGRGGMATVYLAHDLRHHRSVAVKILRPEIAASLGSQRFLREIEIAARLTHPHILPLHDSGEAGDLLYYVMPFIEGESVRERLRREGPLPLEAALRIAREVADALTYAHSQGVVHRDIKPGNILLEAGHAVVADFGIARALTEASSDEITTSGLAIGTPMYMSPEQVAGSRVDRRSDIYSLGCVLYEMLVGQPPFTGPTEKAVAARHVSELPPSLSSVGTAVPPSVVAAVETALAKAPEDRFPDAASFAKALSAGTPAYQPADRGRRQWSRWISIAVGFAVLAIVAFATMFRRGSDSALSSSVGIVVLPFDGPRQSPGTRAAVAQTEALFTEALEWVPGIHTVDGSRLVVPGHSWRELTFSMLLRGARRMGAKYLVSGSLVPTPGSSRVSIDLYAVNDGEQVLHAADTAAGSALDGPVGRLAVQSVNVLARRERLALGARRAIFATTSAAAGGQLLQAYSRFRLGDLDGAATALRSAIEADSNCGLAYHRLSVIQTWRHDDSAALAAVDAGLARHDRLDRQSLARLKGQRQFVLGYGDSAIATFQDAVLDDETDIDAWYGLGEALFHFGAFSAHSPLDARPALDRVAALDSTFAPVYDHLLELALQAGDQRGAEGYLERLRPDDPWKPMREALVALRFGPARGRAAALSRLRTMERPALSQVVISAMHGGRDPALADTVAGFFLGGDRTPDDRRRGGQYRLVALAAQGRWPEAVTAWKSVTADQSFDAWVVQAALAGYPAAELAEPMYAWARQQVTEGRAPDFRRPVWDEVRQGFDALVARATLQGDSAEVTNLLRRISQAPEGSPADPGREALGSSLRGRLALLARDTAQAVSLLQKAVSRIPEPWTANYPLTAMAPQRYLLAELLTGMGEPAEAARWRDSFSNSWAITDVLYMVRMGQPGRRPGG